MPDILIRFAAPDDTTAIAAIHVASWKATYRGIVKDGYLDLLTTEDRLGMWQRIISVNDPRISVLVAEVEGRVAGFASAGPSRESSTGELYAMYIAPDRVRSGIGSRLITRVEEAMREAGFGTAILWVALENPAARAFYERVGWVADGAEKHVELFGQSVIEVRYSRSLVSG